METYESVANEASILFDRALTKVVEANLQVQQGNEPRTGPLFFPKGIELIYMSLNVGGKIELTFSIAGPDAKYPGKKESAMTITGSKPPEGIACQDSGMARGIASSQPDLLS
jgi:hypothetical protein